VCADTDTVTSGYSFSNPLLSVQRATAGELIFVQEVEVKSFLP